MVSWTEIKGKEITLKTIRIWQKVSVTEWLGRGLVICMVVLGSSPSCCTGYLLDLFLVVLSHHLGYALYTANWAAS